MKVLLVNGSPHKNGCTYTALCEVAKALNDGVKQDEEGMQIMRFLGRNMAYYLKCIDAGKKAGVSLPPQEQIDFTNFIR